MDDLSNLSVTMIYESPSWKNIDDRIAKLCNYVCSCAYQVMTIPIPETDNRLCC